MDVYFGDNTETSLITDNFSVCKQTLDSLREAIMNEDIDVMQQLLEEITECKEIKLVPTKFGDWKAWKAEMDEVQIYFIKVEKKDTQGKSILTLEYLLLYISKKENIAIELEDGWYIASQIELPSDATLYKGVLDWFTAT